ncbi:hypothetical protein ABPG73_006322 [Tetrahymena malaccensis]
MQGLLGKRYFNQRILQQVSFKNIPLDDGFGNESTTKLKEALEEAYKLSKIQYINIIKYHKEFQIGNYYFIQVEKCDMSLFDWMKQNQDKKIQRHVFIKFTLQILYAVVQLDSKAYFERSKLKKYPP